MVECMGALLGVCCAPSVGRSCSSVVVGVVFLITLFGKALYVKIQGTLRSNVFGVNFVA